MTLSPGGKKVKVPAYSALTLPATVHGVKIVVPLRGNKKVKDTSNSTAAPPDADDKIEVALSRGDTKMKDTAETAVETTGTADGC